MDILGPLPVLAAFSVVLLLLLIGFGLGGRKERARERTARMKSDTRIWEAVAKGLGGVVESQGDEFRVRFKWNGRDATLSGGNATIFKVAPGSFGSLDLEFLDRSSQPASGPRLKRLEGFEHLCYRGDEQVVRTFLTAPVRRILGDLLECGGGRIEILISDQLRVAATSARTAKNLSRYTVLCLQLAQHARLFVEQSGGVKVVETTSGSAGVCQICGAELGGRLVKCARCATPHHAECWEYVGYCSTYGCGGRSVGV